MPMLSSKNSNARRALQVLFTLASPVTAASALPPQYSSSTSIFSPASTPADSIFGLALFVLTITGVIFLIVAGFQLWQRKAGPEPWKDWNFVQTGVWYVGCLLCLMWFDKQQASTFIYFQF